LQECLFKAFFEPSKFVITPFLVDKYLQKMIFHMKKSRFIIFIFIIGTFTSLYSQEPDFIEKLLENIETDEIGQTDFLQILKDLEDRPINVNTAKVKELLQIPFISFETAKEIISYRNSEGEYSSKKDLLAVPGVTNELIEAIEPYIRFRKPREDTFFNYRLQVGQALHNIRGFEEEGNYENPVYFYHRLRWQFHPNITAHILWEKDAGESDWFDFGSFAIKYHWVKSRSEILLGDFNLETGQRLIFSGAYGQVASIGNPIPFTQAPLRWNLKSSVNENAFLRGVLWNFSPLNKTTFLLAYSDRNLDGSLSADSSTIQSIYATGYHRTQGEILRKNVFSEKILCGIIGKDFSSIQLGLLGASVKYSYPLKIGNNFFNPNNNYMSGFYSFQSGMLRMQGEMAFMNGKYPALQNSLILKGKHFLYGFILYNYHPNFWSFHGRSFGNISESPNNEHAYFFTFSTNFLDHTELSGYYHYSKPNRLTFRFPFLRQSLQIQVTKPIHNLYLLLRYTQRTREGELDISNQMKTRILRFQSIEKITSAVRLTQRLEVSWLAEPNSINGKKDYGLSVYFDARYRPNNKFFVQGRWTQFDVPDYDLRIYEFEADLPGNFRNVLINARGYKWFLLLNYNISRLLSIALKYQEISIPDATVLGSGLDTVFGNKRQFIRAQIQFSD